MSAKRAVLRRAPKPTRSAFAKWPAYIRAIGLATAEMAVLENRLGQMMAAALQIEPRLGQIIYLSSHTAFGRVATLDVAAATVLPATSPALERAKSVAKRSRDLLQTQHQMAHEIWSAAESARRASAKAIAAQTAKLTAHAAAIRNLAEEARSVTRDIRRAASSVGRS